jgi:hypothetical protein
MVLNAPFPYLASGHRAETILPKSCRRVADIVASFMKKILDLPQW